MDKFADGVWEILTTAGYVVQVSQGAGQCVTVEVKDRGNKTWLITASDERQAAREVLAHA